MLTRIEIDGFKTFENFQLELRPFTVVVGPNASGKSNLFDAIKFISLLSQTDIRTAMRSLRGEPDELFRKTPLGTSNTMRFAIEVLLNKDGIDPFGTEYTLRAQRLRYEVAITLKKSASGLPLGIFLERENCAVIKKIDDTSHFVNNIKKVKYSSQLTPFIRMTSAGLREEINSIEIKQDGTNRHGKPITLPAREATRTALSTVTTAEFPHLYALKDLLSSANFLEINPTAARRPSDKYESRTLASDASNLSAVLYKIQQETRSDSEPDGAIADIANDLSSLISNVKSIEIHDQHRSSEFAFDVCLSDDTSFSSRVISDGTIRLLALLTVLNDPNRRGLLCFEEPENGVHEGRIAQLVNILRESTTNLGAEASDNQFFQIIVNTHSPKVMQNLDDNEIVLADTLAEIFPGRGKVLKTRMRTGIVTEFEGFDTSRLTRFEVDKLLKRPSEGI